MPFERADTSPKPPERLVQANWALEKQGKSTNLLSFPDPIFVFNFDYGIKELLESGKYKDREIYLVNYPLPLTAEPREHKPLLLKFEKEWKEAVAQADARHGTVSLDTSDELWGVVGNALTGDVREQRAAKNAAEDKNFQDSQLDWRHANTFMDGILKRPLQFDHVNACYTHRAAEKYTGGKPDGIPSMHGFKTTKYIVQVVLHLYTKQVGLGPDGKLAPPTFKGVMESCRYPQGQPYVGRELAAPDYGTIMELIS